MRVFIASLGTETNTFSPFPTSAQDFAETYMTRGGGHSEPFIFAVPLVVWRRMAEARGWETVESLCTFAQPSGVTLRPVYEGFRDEILADLRAAMPVDMVLLSLHGAMVAEGYDDCEGDLLAAGRAIVGPEVPVGGELDLHCHLTEQMRASATALVAFKEYPHTDFAERAAELFAIVADAAEGKTRPQMALHDCGVIGVYHTTAEAMRSLVARLRELEGRDGVLSVSVAHGFPWGDVPDVGTRVLVVSDGRPEAAAALAARLGDELVGLYPRLQPRYWSVADAIEHAAAAPRGPVVLADVADNAGGGAPNDSTFLLRAILARGGVSAAVGCIWDPVAAATALRAGVGASLRLRVGGKMGPMSGDPLDLDVTVTGVAPGAVQSFGEAGGRATARMGDSAALRVRGTEVDVVVNAVRTQTFSPDVFTVVGINPHERRLLVVKSMQHFYAAFAPIAAETLYVASPGALTPEMERIPYRRARLRAAPARE
jgi:microcystin degradation protein MlrC